ncbi:hypothetical protein GYMLUDRAFT_160501 [Collybiopsis luxurians FD-317 M1]|nr:hypothetical protein GYMLUDRAFT_160501 [Collybiopsis luxurians FD-317 M1]
MYWQLSNDLQLVTIIDCICTDGTAPIKPAFIFLGAKMHHEWILLTSCTKRVATSENGWTDNEIGFEWFKKSFVPQATAWRPKNAATSDKPILLIYDRHASHVSPKWIDLALANNIILLCLPPHTTHCLQPLDVGCFGPLQMAWFNCCDEILEQTSESMDLHNIVKEYWECQNLVSKETTILQAWHKAGINPFNPNIFTDADYMPSIPSST